ncbi:uncharacterized protein LOC109604733 isoform X2 [Aethina tumida]|uniref:uncharacterized protein LOC109604733 isoform X2 n=1 Tax=Aethina tumida TaxID=116153 RepID=UPI00096B41CA|nr:uncharacterized protein LOC109604733 isoform X2 [Aethina tumida]
MWIQHFTQVKEGKSEERKTNKNTSGNKDHLPLKKRRVDPQFCKNLFNNAEGPEVRTTRASQAADKKELAKKNESEPTIIGPSAPPQVLPTPLFLPDPVRSASVHAMDAPFKMNCEPVSPIIPPMNDNEFLNWDGDFKNMSLKPKEPPAETIGQTFEERMEEIRSIIETDEQDFAKYKESRKQHMAMIGDIIDNLKKASGEKVKAAEESPVTANVPYNMLENHITADSWELRKPLFTVSEEPSAQPPVGEEPKIEEVQVVAVTVDELVFLQDIASRLLTQVQDFEQTIS